MSKLTTILPLLLAGALGAQTSYWTGTLNGAQETPPNASTATGKACVTLNGTTLTCTVVTTPFVTAATAGHIHKGAVGVAGGVVIPFTGPVGLTWSASVTVTAAQIADLQAGLYYANIHTTAFSGGEIRGQLGPAAPPKTFGTGCVGTNAKTPAIGAKDFACIGVPFTITLADARASSKAGLLLGTSNTSFNAIPLPFALGVIGMPGCSLLTSDLGLGLSANTDASGAGSLSIPIPLNIALANLVLYSQWFPLDVGANPLGVVVSNALAFTLQ